MYYSDSLNKLIFIILALTVPVSYIVFRIKPNLLHLKLFGKRTKFIAITTLAISLFVLTVKLIVETCYISNAFLEMFDCDLGYNYYPILVVLVMWSICILNLKILRIILNIIFIISGVFWLVGHQHQFYLYQIYTLISLNAAIIGINMQYPYKSNKKSFKSILDIILIWIAIIIFSFIYQQPLM